MVNTEIIFAWAYPDWIYGLMFAGLILSLTIGLLFLWLDAKNKDNSKKAERGSI
jgi:hypothetical protein